MTQLIRVERQHLIALPVFPLPELVFFPNTGIPLNIFEPRYREMTAYCLEEKWPMAIVCISPTGEKDKHGRPEVEKVATAGPIVASEQTSDGRYQILLAGLQRVRLIDELEFDEPFRRFRCEALDDATIDPPSLEEKMATLRGCLMSLQQTLQTYEKKGVLDPDVFKLDDPAVLTNALAAPLMPSVEERQSFLECVDVGERLDRIIERVAEVIAVTSPKTSFH